MASTSQSLNALLKRTTIEDHEEVLEACNANLKKSKDDIDVQHAKLVALLKLDRYEDALRVLETAGGRLKQKARFEWAYALYKIGDYEQATAIANGVGDQRGARHVEAQALYRLEDYVKVAGLYKDLAGTQAAIENEENDLRINSGATDAQLEWKRQGNLVLKKKPGREDLEAFETAYNAACGSIARGDLGQAEVLLKRSRDLCNSLDDLSAQEKTAELLPIGVQQLYVLTRLVKTEDAEKTASEIAIEEIPDLSTRQIAQNNKLSSTTTHTNPYRSHRLFHSSADLPKTDMLFGFQADRMRQNSLALDLLTLKSSGTFISTSKLLSDKPPTTSTHANSISVINAAARAQNELGKLGLKRILPLFNQRPTDVGLALTIIQLYILTNNHGSATSVMESLLKSLSESSQAAEQDVRFAPGLVAVAVSLYTSQGRTSQIKAELAKAASYWRHRSKPPPIVLLQTAGLALLDSSKSEDLATAREIFSHLHSQDPSSKLATVGYIAAHSLPPSSSKDIAAEINTLTPIPRLTAGIDVLALETAGVPHQTPQSSSALDDLAARRKRALDEKSAKPAKKRVRKSKLPKDYEEGKVMDPERWLPLRDRSSYRPKGRKGKMKAAAMTQGGVSEKTEGAKGGEIVKAAAAQGKTKKKKGKK